MDEAERQARIAHFRAERERWVCEENERVRVYPERNALNSGCYRVT